jgi:hypothetical protein
MRVRTAVRPGLLVVTAGLALVLSACGGSDEPAAESAPATSAPTASAAADAPRAGTAAAARPVAAPQPTVAPADLANFSCVRRHGVWSARGDVSNPTRDPMVYTVTVVTVAGADIAGEDTSRFVLRPGSSASFELPAISTGPADDCLPRLLREPR